MQCWSSPVSSTHSLVSSSRNQARSDYTYSASLTYRDRVTPDRKIGSPNMARRGLRGGNTNYIKTPDFSSSDLSFENDDSSQLNLRTRTILRPMDALSGRLPPPPVVAPGHPSGAVLRAVVLMLCQLKRPRVLQVIVP